MTTPRTVLSQLEILADGNIGVRFIKQLMDGNTLVGFPPEPYHRMTLPAGCPDDVINVVFLGNAAHLNAMGYPLQGSVDLLAKIKAHAGLAWTDEHRVAYAEAARQQAEREAKAREDATRTDADAKAQRQAEITEAVEAVLAARSAK